MEWDFFLGDRNLEITKANGFLAITTIFYFYFSFYIQRGLRQATLKIITFFAEKKNKMYLYASTISPDST